jgi:1-acyl-sn-glycerol-3-phosphate acyltransferase
MHRTIFQTPIVNTLLRGFSVAFLKATGWKIEGHLPANGQKSVLIAAPHTSNWDLPYTLMVAFALRLNIYWMGKVQIFRFPFRGLMMWLGGIPVQRDKAGAIGGAARGHAQPHTLLENRLLLHCHWGPSAHRVGLFGLFPQSHRPGPGV